MQLGVEQLLYCIHAQPTRMRVQLLAPINNHGGCMLAACIVEAASGWVDVSILAVQSRQDNFSTV